MKLEVAVDVSPLVQTRAGTARHVRGLLGALERREDVAVRRLSFGGGSRPAAALRDMLWYPVLLPLAAARRDVSVLHCPTFRGPLRSRVPLVVTVHDLAVLRHPASFRRWSRTYSAAVVGRVLRAATRVI